MNNKNKKQSGYSLMEVVIALFLLSILTLTFSASAIATRKAAESDLYESTANAVAAGYMEQFWMISKVELEADQVASPSTVTFKKGSSAGALQDDLFTLGVYNTRTVTIHTDSNGNPTMTMSIDIMPTVASSSDMTVLNTSMVAKEFKIYCKWKIPVKNMNKTNTICVKAIKNFSTVN